VAAALRGCTLTIPALLDVLLLANPIASSEIPKRGHARLAPVNAHQVVGPFDASCLFTGSFLACVPTLVLCLVPREAEGMGRVHTPR